MSLLEKLSATSGVAVAYPIAMASRIALAVWFVAVLAWMVIDHIQRGKIKAHGDDDVRRLAHELLVAENEDLAHSAAKS